MSDRQKCPRCGRLIRLVTVPGSKSWFATHDDFVRDKPCTASSKSLEDIAREDAATPITDQINAAKFHPFERIEKR